MSANNDGAHTESQPEQQDLGFSRQPFNSDFEGDSLIDQSEPPTLQSTQSKSVKTILSQLLPSGPLITPILVGC